VLLYLEIEMSKGYVKDPKGKYRLVDKENQGPETQLLTLENVNLRLQKVESILSELMK
jgi:hypothetical protein